MTARVTRCLLPALSSGPGFDKDRDKDFTVFVIILVSAMIWIGSAAGCSSFLSADHEPGLDQEFLQRHGIEYGLTVKTEPRPLRIHQLRIDLHHPQMEVATALTADPDGDGPAEAALEPPLAIARRIRALALVNAPATRVAGISVLRPLPNALVVRAAPANN